MRLPRIFRRFVEKAPGRAELRETRLSKIKALGFHVDDLSGWFEGKYASRRYRLVDADGRVLDNNGSGYVSSSEAYRAAVTARQGK